MAEHARELARANGVADIVEVIQGSMEDVVLPEKGIDRHREAKGSREGGRNTEKIALSEAEKNAQVSKILMEQKLMEKDSSKRQQQIDNEMFLAREKALADANYYRITKEAEANRLKLTPEYLELRFIESIANNSKIFFGEKIPNMIMDQRLLRNYLDADSSKGHLKI